MDCPTWRAAVKALPVQMGIAREGSDSAVSIGDIAKSQKKHARIFVLKASVQIVSRVIRVPQRFLKPFTVGFSITVNLWYPSTPSNISAPSRYLWLVAFCLRRKARPQPRP